MGMQADQVLPARVVALTVIRLTKIHELSSSPDPLFSYVSVLSWTQAEMAYSLATATIPCVIPIMMKLDTHVGAFDARTVAASDSEPYGTGRSRLGASLKTQKQHLPSESEVSNSKSAACLQI